MALAAGKKLQPGMAIIIGIVLAIVLIFAYRAANAVDGAISKAGCLAGGGTLHFGDHYCFIGKATLTVTD